MVKSLELLVRALNVKRIGMKRESFEKYEDIEQFLPKFDGENGYDQMLEFRDDVLPLIMTYGYDRSIDMIKKGKLLELAQMPLEDRKEKIEKMIKIGVEK